MLITVDVARSTAATRRGRPRKASSPHLTPLTIPLRPASRCWRTAWPTTTPIPSPRITSYAEPSRSLEKAATDRWSRPQRSRYGASGRIMVAGQNIKLGPRHRGKIVTVVIEDTPICAPCTAKKRSPYVHDETSNPSPDFTSPAQEPTTQAVKHLPTTIRQKFPESIPGHLGGALKSPSARSGLAGPGTLAELDAARRTRWRHFSAMTKLLVQSWHGDS